MIFTADLHTHSTASDGQYTPTQLVGLAKDKGLQLLALTDHDTLDGLEEAVQAGEALGLRVLRGVEGIEICRLTDSDVVRHVIVQRIIKAYEDDENKRKAKRSHEKT